MSFSLCIVCDANVSCRFFPVFVKMKDRRFAEEFASASPVLTGRIRTLDVLGSFGQKMSATFFRNIWPQAMLQNENTITAFTFVASSLHGIWILTHEYKCNSQLIPKMILLRQQQHRFAFFDSFFCSRNMRLGHSLLYKKHHYDLPG